MAGIALPTAFIGATTSAGAQLAVLGVVFIAGIVIGRRTDRIWVA